MEVIRIPMRWLRIHYLKGALVFGAVGASLIWVGGFVAAFSACIAIGGGTIYGLASNSGSFILVTRRCLDGERGAFVVRLGGFPRAASDGRMDFTKASDDASLGWSIRLRRYVTRWHLGGVVAQTGREVTNVPVFGGGYAVRYEPIDAWVLVLPWWLVVIAVGAAVGPQLWSCVFAAPTSARALQTPNESKGTERIKGDGSHRLI